MEQLEVDLICPGHGSVAGRELLARQKRYFVELRLAVQKGIAANQSLAEIESSIDLPWYHEWTGVAARENKDNIKHVHDELTGKVDHGRLGSRPAPVEDWRLKPVERIATD
jgi:hypothetical protein